MMQTLTEIRALLAARGVRPKHRLGQNFLHDQNLIRKLIAAAEIQAGERVLEVGPGTGALTEALLDAGAEVIASEIDRDMIAILRDRVGERITLIEGDVLAKKHEISGDVLSAIDGRKFKLIANLPYSIASPLIANLLINHARQCTGIFVTIQKEVADRLVAQPGGKEYGPLTIIAQAFARVERIAVLPRDCFWPRPEVTSAMVAIVPEVEVESPGDRPAFAMFITQLFSKRRKQLGAILGRDVKLPDGIDPTSRPEQLSIEQLVTLFGARRDNANP